MLLHVVCFKYKPEIDEAARARHLQHLEALRDLDLVVDLKVGPDVVRSARSYDAGLVVIFPDRAAHDAYQRHPAHVPVAELGREISDSVVVVDIDA
jgi:stress responsive alpha/beta barrel protein